MHTREADVEETHGVLPFGTSADVAAALPRVIAHLHAERVIAYPTETVYGLGSTVTPNALAAVAELKGRSASQPALVLVDAPARLEAMGLSLNAPARALASAFWPGPLTLVVSAHGATVPRELVGSTGGIAVRHTSHPGAAAIVAALGAPILSTSANAHGLPPETSATKIAARWKRDVDAGLLLVLDAGEIPVRPASTVVDCTTERPVLARAGAIDVARLRAVVPELTERA